MQKKPYKELSSVLEYENPYMKVFHKKLEYSKKKQNDYWVLHRRNPSFSIVIPLFPNKDTVLVGQYRVPIDEFSWEFPMGSVDGKEAEVAALQELKEETGLVAKKIDRIGSYHVVNSYTPQMVHVFAATDLNQEVKEPEEFEIIETKRVSISKVEKMILDGTIKDGPTISAMFYLENYLKKMSSRT